MRLSQHTHIRDGSDYGQTMGDETGYTLCGRDNSTVHTISERAHDEYRQQYLCAVCERAYDARNRQRWYRASPAPSRPSSRPTPCEDGA